MGGVGVFDVGVKVVWTETREKTAGTCIFKVHT